MAVVGQAGSGPKKGQKTLSPREENEEERMKRRAVGNMCRSRPEGVRLL